MNLLETAKKIAEDDHMGKVIETEPVFIVLRSFNLLELHWTAEVTTDLDGNPCPKRVVKQYATYESRSICLERR